MAGFADAHKSAIASGFPDTIDTYGLVSGLWTSTFALGAFIGPTLAGILFDSVGFPYGTLLIIIIHIFVLLLLLVNYVFCKKPSLPEVVVIEEDEPMLPPSRRDYGSVEDQQPGPSSRTRIARTRKYSEAVSGSVAKSISMVYPQFIATSYV